mmetsp:Transcript_16336/g.28234  ORF Transcript_16336/g.28234 Transcript_16336/m.28234 type:complete len:307 (-) Transcript_16336:1295-2215(-)
MMIDCACPYCGKVYCSKQYVRKHIAAVHENRRDFPCPVCNKEFTQSSSLKRHIDLVHEKRYKCTLCTREFKKASQLVLHTEVAHSKKAKIDTKASDNLMCHICHKDFGQKSDLTRHVRTVHEGLKQFKCNICSKRFSGSASLKNHVRAIHENVRFFCDKCGREFSRQDSLQRHLLNIHNQTDDKSNSSPLTKASIPIESSLWRKTGDLKRAFSEMSVQYCNNGEEIAPGQEIFPQQTFLLDYTQTNKCSIPLCGRSAKDNSMCSTHKRLCSIGAEKPPTVSEKLDSFADQVMRFDTVMSAFAKNVL